jgi:small subunit ribosomal protein S3
MGRKVHPKVFRLHTLTTWSSRWFADRKHYRTYLEQDVRLRETIREKYRGAGVADVEIERSANALTVTIHTARPGMIIGRGGAEAEQLKEQLRQQLFGQKKKGNPSLQLNIVEVDRPALNADVVLHQVIGDLEKRIPFRRVIRQAVGRVERAGAQGVRVQVSGRLNGAEIARTESMMYGSVPLQTLRADISYAQSFARTIYGSVGVKVWIYRGDVFGDQAKASAQGKSATPPVSKRPNRRGPARLGASS